MADPLKRFSGAAAWRDLSEASRDRIGAIALEMVAAWAEQDRPDGEDPDEFSPRARAAGAADIALISLLQTEVMKAVDFDPDGPGIPSLIGDVCRACGCSQDDACDGGCAWTEPGLCSACAEAAVTVPEI